MKEELLDIGSLEKAALEGHLHSEFQIELETEEEGGALVLELLELSSFPDHRPEGARDGRAPFSAVFGCATHRLPQNTYFLTHPILGKMMVFLSPIENYHEGHKLEAVFS